MEKAGAFLLVAAAEGIEPSMRESKSRVLPFDDAAKCTLSLILLYQSNLFPHHKDEPSGVACEAKTLQFLRSEEQ